MNDVQNANAPREAEGGDSNFDIKKILDIARRRWVFAVPVGAVVAILVFLVNFMQTPIYSASVRVLIDTSPQRVVDSDGALPSIGSSASEIESELHVIRSEILARRVVERLDLESSPAWNPSLREVPRYQQIMSRVRSPLSIFRSAANALRPETPTSGPSASVDPDLSADIEPGPPRALVRRVANSIRAQRLGLSYVIEITVTSIDPRQAALVANAYGDAYLDAQLDARYEAARRANDWLSVRMEDLRDEVRIKESAVEAYRAENGLVEAAGALLTDQDATSLQASILNARTDLAEKRARLRQVRDLINSGGSLDAVASVMNYEVITELRRQEAEVARQQADLEARYFDQHPEVQEVRLLRQDIQNQIQMEIDRIVRNLENELEVAQTRLTSLENSAAEVQQELLENNRAAVRLRELERDAQAARAQMENFLGRFQQIADQESLPVTDAQVIAEANAPRSPQSPSFRGAFVAALFLGGMAAAGVTVMLEMMDEVIRFSDDITKRLGVPLLAVSPRVTGRDLSQFERAERDPAQFVVEKPMSAFAESLRMLRSSVTYANLDRRPGVVAITSASTGEGKTTVSLALGRVSGAAGQRVLLIDCDLRRHSLSDFARETPEYGLLDVLAGNASMADAIVRDSADMVDMLSAKSGAFTPVDVFGTDAMGELLERARQHYDLVICDCAPALAVAETRIIARRADACVMVVRWGKSQFKPVRAALRELRQTGVHVTGVMFNAIGQAGSRGEYYGALYYSKAYQKYYANS